MLDSASVNSISSMPSRVPVQERLAAEHRRELLAHAAKHLLDAGVVADKGDGHLQALGRDVADGGLDVVRDPLNEVGRVLVLHVEHLLVICSSPSSTCGRGRAQTPSGSDRGAGLQPASCSLHRTSAASALARTDLGTAASRGS
ncbi:hypothetical protein TcYC6_0003130 [Trypanosoma cruzi]|nr:hypothetical protein TcYC6_0003130 [Trypanosoma cruzi]